MPPGAVTTSETVRHGPQTAESESPKITTEGTPKAAATWAGPESFPTNSAAVLRRDLISASGAPETGGQARKGERSSPAPPMKIGSRPVRFKCSATARKPSARQVFAAVAATG